MASIVLENVGVHYLLPQEKATSLLRSMRPMAMGGVIRKDHGRIGVTAVEDVSLSLKDGDRLGLIGHNGAGKSTLLRVLASILPPTSGRVRIEGRISALMSIHLGLIPHETGFENIRIRARHMGCAEEEINARFDEIAAFSELGDYLALPLKTYSSGMRLRLAFSIATAFSPDILILDEWLSAGDKAFQIKAAERLTKLIDRTGIFAFASHNTDLHARMCNKSLVMENGRAVFLGDVKEAADFATRGAAEPRMVRAGAN